MDRETNGESPANPTGNEISGQAEAPLISGQLPVPKGGMLVRGLIGLLILLALAIAGRTVADALHLTLPGPVIGLAVLATVVVLVERFHTWSHRHLTLHLEPVSRLLVSHLGLLFVPAGVGIIAEGDALRKEWLPLVAALAGSTLIGLAATGWFMNRFGPKNPDAKP